MSLISSILWFVTTLMIIFIGIYLSFYLKFPQLKVSNFVNLFKKNDNNSLKLLNLSLAGKIGVGSISGIAIAIIVGGKGALLWVWLSSIVLSIITYSETILGIKYGSPKEYMRYQLKNKKLSNIYSILIIIIYLVAFILIQSNTIIISFESTFNVDKIFIIVFLLLIIFLSINKDVNRISNIVSLIVPVMGFIYTIIGFIVIINHSNVIPSIIADILRDSFSFKSISTIPIIIGFERAIFCNEAGMGTTSMIASLSKNKDYKVDTAIQVLGTYFISLVVCTISAFIILTTNYELFDINNINGIEIVTYAFYYHFDNIGPIILSLITFLFAYSTIITSYYYGKINLKRDTHSKFIVIIMVLVSTIIEPNRIWQFIDILISLVTIINLVSIFKLRKKLRSNI